MSAMHFFRKLSAATCCTLILLLPGCTGNAPRHASEKVMFTSAVSLAPESVHPLVTAYTGGTVTAGCNISVQLTDDPLRLQAESGVPLQTEIFSLTPKVAGKTYLEQHNMLVFKPDHPLDHGTLYKVEVHLDRVADTRGLPATFTYKLLTLPLTVSFTPSGWQTTAASRNEYVLEREVLTSDQADAALLEQCLTVTMDGAAVQPEWTHSDGLMSHTFRLAHIRPESRLRLEWDGKPLGISLSATEDLTAPDPQRWEVNSVDVTCVPECCITVTFPAPLDKTQRITDFITLSDGTGMRADVSGNRVRLYPAERISGPVTLTVHPGLGDDQGHKTGTTRTFPLEIDAIVPQVCFLQSGSILPDSGRIVLPVKSVNYAGIDIRVGRISTGNLVNYLQNNDIDDEYSIYRVQDILGEMHVTLGTEDDKSLQQWRTWAIDLTDMVKQEPGAVYRIYLRGTDPLAAEPDNWYDSDYLFGTYETRKERIRSLMVSDLGLIVKGDDFLRYSLTASSLKTAEAMPDVTVVFYDKLNREIGRGMTGQNGVFNCVLPSAPSVVTASKGLQTGFLRLGEQNSLSLSSFDASGAAVSEGINGMIYGERGVWRPGDSLLLTFALTDREGLLPARHPVRMRLINPLGQTIGEQVKTIGANGLYSFHWATGADAVTGRWKAEVTVGDRTFTKMLPVETIKPNRLRIDFSATQNGQAWENRLSAAYLTGMPASGLHAAVDMLLTPVKTVFAGFKDYIFDDPAVLFKGEEKQIFNGALNDAGSTVFQTQPASLPQVPGMLRGRFTVRVTEADGNLNSTSATSSFAPYAVFAGIRAASSGKGENNLHRWRTDKDIPVEIAAVLADGSAAKNVSKARMDLYRVNWSWWWDIASGNDEAAYRQDLHQQLVSTQEVALQQGKGSTTLRFKEKESGYYFVRISFPEAGVSAHTTGLFADVDSYLSYDEDNDAATRLLIASDKAQYKVGDIAKVEAPAPDGAVAVVSVETGHGQLSTFRVTAGQGKVRFPLSVTPEMAPNCYVYISLVQPHGHKGNDLPIRLYGVIPLLVEDPATRLSPVIKAPESVRPEKTFEVTVSEKDGRPMSYTLSIVDEGLLGLTAFKAPDLHAFFYAREAIGVRTWDMYNRVMGAYGGHIGHLFAVGGDGEEGGAPSPMQQRFGSVAMSLGPFTIDGGKSLKHTVTLPPYIGNVRVTVVAADGKAFGTTTRDISVKQPLMVQTTLPRRLAPGESFELPVTVFAMEDRLGEVEVNVSAGDALHISGPASQTLRLDAKGERTLCWTVRGVSTGTGTISVTARSGKESASSQTLLGVSNPSRRVYTSVLQQAEPGKSVRLSTPLPGEAGTNNAVLTLTTLPPLQLERRLSSLLSCPFGSLEETVSAAFPQLYLASLAEVTAQRQAEAAQNISMAVKQLVKYQTASGGMSFWPGGTRAHPWVTSYAGVFMLEAEKNGYPVPAALKTAWLQYQTARAKSWRAEDEGDSDMTQAFRLYSLAAAHKPEMSAMNRLRELPWLSEQARYLLAGTYLLAGQPGTAAALADRQASGQGSRSLRAADTFGSSDRDLAILLELQTALDRREAGYSAYTRIAARLASDDALNSQSTAWMLKAVAGYLAKYRLKAVPVLATVTASGASLKGAAQADSTGMLYTIPVENTAEDCSVQISSSTKAPLHALLTVSGIPAAGGGKAYNRHLQLQVRYEDADGRPVDVRKLSQNTRFFMVTTVTHNAPERGAYHQLVLSEIFPSGWEILSDRLYEDGEEPDGDTERTDIRDDRIYRSFDLKPGESKVFRTPLAATYAGSFQHPQITCEAMYDHETGAASDAFPCEVYGL